MRDDQAHREDAAWPCNSDLSIEVQSTLLEVNPCQPLVDAASCVAADVSPLTPLGNAGDAAPISCHWCGRDIGCWPADASCMLDEGATQHELSRVRERRDGDKGNTGGRLRYHMDSMAGKSVYMVFVDRFGTSNDELPATSPRIETSECGTMEVDCNSTGKQLSAPAKQASRSACFGDRWCGGTIRGLIDGLPYIEEMGFDCVWIAPVLQTVTCDDPRDAAFCQSAYHGCAHAPTRRARGTRTHARRHAPLCLCRDTRALPIPPSAPDCA